MAILDSLDLYLPSFEGRICWGSEERREKKEKARAKSSIAKHYVLLFTTI